MKYKYDIIFILASGLIILTLLFFNMDSVIKNSLFMLCLSSYFIGKYINKIENQK